MRASCAFFKIVFYLPDIVFFSFTARQPTHFRYCFFKRSCPRNVQPRCAMNDASPYIKPSVSSREGKPRKERTGVKVVLNGFPVPVVPLALICSSPGGHVG